MNLNENLFNSSDDLKSLDDYKTERNNYPDYIEKVYDIKVPPGQTPERLDTYLTRVLENATRTRVQKAIDTGCVTINGLQVKASRKIQPRDNIICKIMKPPPIELVPENIPLEIAYEDNYLMVVNKPAGMCTHPGHGNRYGTLVNAVLYHLGFRESVPIELDEDEEENPDEGVIFSKDAIRPGVVHRLDKDTSGLLLVAKNPEIHAKLAKQFADRTTDREYNALVWGNFKEDSGTITGDIGRSPRDRKLFAVVKKDGKHAVTNFKVIERYDFLTLLQLKLQTGRTHQIRVHCSNIHHPVFGDRSYGGDTIVYGGSNPQKKKLADSLLKMVDRQLLHARTLGFTHPVTKERIYLTSDLPEDMKNVIEVLKSFQSV